MDDTQFDVLAKRLDLLTRLLAITAVRGLAPKEQVRLLRWAGLRPKEIGDILNKTPNAIRIIMFELKKKKKTSK